jgi:hypothetical protein
MTRLQQNIFLLQAALANGFWFFTGFSEKADVASDLPI